MKNSNKWKTTLVGQEFEVEEKSVYLYTVYFIYSQWYHVKEKKIRWIGPWTAPGAEMRCYTLTR